ncbi:MAG: NAD(P)(+) transhydrogenase (Re/Si-specific) subunit beta [Clostridia bacterium]|nr:NAD(P)(+) transhydrogenase (Re/Si-specific) subunit beta [Clostridia bacterium]
MIIGSMIPTSLLPDTAYYILSAALVLGVLAGIYLMSKVEKAYNGNTISAVCMALAIVLTMLQYNVFGSDVRTALVVIIVAMLIGGAIGAWIAKKVKMIQMPQTVALLNGFGGGASAFVAILTLLAGLDPASSTMWFDVFTGMLALVVGIVTLVGSLVAAAKLQGLMKSKPVVIAGHSPLTMVSLFGSLILCIVAIFVPQSMLIWVVLGLLLSCAFGLLFSIRVGGADMPITISLLNSFSGVAGSIAGLAIGDVLLVAVGGIVGASGLILTQIMCKAMNRSLLDILLGKTSAGAKKAEAPAKVEEKKEEAPAVAEEAPKSEKPSVGSLLKNAKDVIIIPGYGMALAQAQANVKQLADKLTANGANVRYAIHPVAGRMPGHMNVLLAEVDVDYDQLFEMKAIDDDFKNADLAIIVGANDVTNPAAKEAEGTPIYGMPVLSVADCKNIIICNFDLKPGYAGVENPLYTREDGVEIFLGDAKESVSKLITAMDSDDATAPAAAETEAPAEAKSNIGATLKNAKSVIIVPGYGMALAQAQANVKQLADKLAENGADVRYAIHPVAGRMPGHMNVLLAEVDVDYDQLFEMKAIDDDFKNTDLTIVVGANDVTNPAAKEAEGTPIYGMPVLSVADSKNIIICNYDLKPGYAGVENPLYTSDKAEILLGDAKESIIKLMAAMDGADDAPSAAADDAAPAKSGMDLAAVLKDAKNVIIVPGYGMALAQAQANVKQLADKLAENGANVRYAIHPVAGRMPGHMNVLLAEVDVDYDQLYEMKAIDDDFKDADLCIVVGANDVTNPAAKEAEGTPIYGMPVLSVADAANIIICNFDTKPGYAGVENPLYTSDKAELLLGDAKESIMKLIALF